MTFKAIHNELERLGYNARLEKGDGYFYFWSSEANDWLDRTVKVSTLSGLALETGYHSKQENNRGPIIGTFGLTIGPASWPR